MKETLDSNQLNEYVRSILAPYLNGNYQLSPLGQEKVIAANSKLDSEYAHAHNLLIVDWCFKEIRSKIDLMRSVKYHTMLDMCVGTHFISFVVFSEC